MLVQGICPPKFEELKNIFQEYFDNNEETGANFSIVKNNEILVNIFGGQKSKNSSWDENTIVNTFSLSKGIYASCIAKLIEENEIDIERKVSFYWPEFKINKEKILVKDILSHQSGLFRFKEKISNEDLLNFEKITYILEKQNPDHEPGEKTYYHAKTHGYLVENLIRRIAKKSLKEFFYENFSKKHDLNFNFGFKEDDFYNVSDLIENNIAHEETNQEFNAFNNPKHEINFYNSKKWRLSGVPSMGGHGSALSVAKLYDLLANDLKSDHKKIISQKKFKKILVQSPARLDESLKLPIKWTYSGYILRGGWMFGKNKESFGHNGWGGSLGFGDPIEGIGIAYVTRKINSSMAADSRAVNLIKKTYEIFNN
jgi:CubicO group peptidase (beta-lactamase class C family)